jgi:signal transduction histidine kinase
VLALLVVMTGIVVWLPSEPWQIVAPLALVFPMLLFRPVFAAAGAFIVSSSIVFTTIASIEHLGSNDSIADRILEAQASILLVALASLILSALFAERRQNEIRLARTAVMLERERANKMMSIQAVTASIAHGVRQPLTGITVTSFAARRWLRQVPLDVTKVEELLRRIEEASFHADDVLKTMRGLFQSADREFEPIDANMLALNALELLRAELGDRGIQSVVELASELPLVMGHPTQLQEVVVNLVHNAIDAMDLVEARHRILKVRTRRNGGKRIVIEVEDSGRGIEPERIGSIFEAFVMTKPGGPGLGLAICARVAERHGGRLTASSDGKSGAVFRITLPIESASRSPATPNDPVVPTTDDGVGVTAPTAILRGGSASE